MKHYLIGVGLLLYAWAGYSQTTQLNQEKYWKFRNNFKERFVKIGPATGESLPIGAILPNDCVDTYDTNEDGNGWGQTKYGELRWGDGMIRHGHYLTLLATEYRLLKNNGQNEQAQATLNELYYALNALFRLDYNAEANQDVIHGTNSAGYTLNGFYNREDVPENFDVNWKTDRTNIECTNSAFYRNNNSGKVDDLASGKIVRGNSYQNVPSMDQMSSLLVGLAMVSQLVDGVTVQPASTDIPKDLRQQAKEHIYFMIQYAARNNWYILDVHGWPVNNGGGDLLLMGPPLLRAYDRFWGGSINTLARRKQHSYKDAQAYAVGFGIDGPFTGGWTDLGPMDQFVYYEIFNTVNHCAPFPTGQFANSRFLNWQNCGLQVHANATVLQNMWTNFIPEHWADIYADWDDNYKLDHTFGMDGTLFDETFGNISWGVLPLKNNNNTIMFNLGVLTGWWNASVGDNWANTTGNRELELINCILNGFTPAHQSSFYKPYLDQLSLNGPYDLEAGHWNGSTTTNMKTAYPANGWGAEYRWIDGVDAGTWGGEKGVFNAMDYMVFYNLYHLLFSNQLPEYKESWTCNCGPNPAVAPFGDVNDIDAFNNLNDKLSYVTTCQENAFYPVNNMVSGQFIIQPKFSNYIPMGIYTTEYQTQNAAVLPGGDINVQTRFVICNGTLNIQAGARIDVERKEMIVNTNGIVNNSGDILVREGTQLVLKSGSKLTLRSGSTLKIEANAKLIIEDGATLEYYNGADLRLLDQTSEIVHGGTIRTMDQTTFDVTSSSLTTQKGKYRFIGSNATFRAEQPAYFRLVGKGINDPFITIDPGARLQIDDQDIISFRVADCTIDIKQNGYIRAEETMYMQHVKLNSSFTNGGVTVTDAHSFVDCHFNHVPVKAPMNIENASVFSAYACTFSASNMAINGIDIALLKVTGMGLSLTNCIFTANRTYCVQAASMTQISSIGGCTFTKVGDATGSTMIGVSDISTVELKVTNSNFQKCLHGIYKSGGKLSLKCNVFQNNNYCNIKTLGGATLNMSINDLAGYNYLLKSLQNKSIEVTAATINLKNGYNFIESCTNTIAGTTSFTCVPPGCQVDLANNQWNTVNMVPSTALFQIMSANGFIVLPLVATVTPKPACGYYDGPIVIEPPKGKSTFAADGMPIIWSAIENDSVRLSDAIVAGMERMTTYDSLGNDLEAVERFNEIYSSDIDMTDSLTRNYVWFASEQMKSSLENAFAHGQILLSDNATGFDPHTAMYVNALTFLTEPIDENNYQNQFYHEINKAHLLRAIGHPDIGLNILTELEACGIDSAEQAWLNHWKTVFQEDMTIEQIGLEALDSTIIIDTTGYIPPALAVNAFSFGAIITDLNNIAYPNCDFYQRDLNLKKTNGLIVFPNPATREVTIRWNSRFTEGKGSLSVSQPDGRIMLAKAVDMNELMELRINVSDWQPGVYQVRFQQQGGIVSTAQLIVQ